MVLHDLLGSCIHEQLQKVQSASSAEVHDESDASVDHDSVVACWHIVSHVPCDCKSRLFRPDQSDCRAKSGCLWHNAGTCMQNYVYWVASNT